MSSYGGTSGVAGTGPLGAYEWETPPRSTSNWPRVAITAQAGMQSAAAIPGFNIIYMGVPAYDGGMPVLPQTAKFHNAVRSWGTIMADYTALNSPQYLTPTEVTPFDWGAPTETSSIKSRSFRAMLSQLDLNYNPALYSPSYLVLTGAELYEYGAPTESLSIKARFLSAFLAQDNVIYNSGLMSPVYQAPGQVPCYDWGMHELQPFYTRYQQAIRSEVRQIHQLYIGHDKIYQGDGEVPGYDWPNPIRFRPYDLKAIYRDNWNIAANFSLNLPYPNSVIILASNRTYVLPASNRTLVVDSIART